VQGVGSVLKFIGMTAIVVAVPILVHAQPAHIYGIHDDSSVATDWTTRCPGGASWMTATEALGANPLDLSSKNYNPVAGSKVVARLNYGYFPQGTIPVAAQYANFAQRVKNFVQNSTGCDTWVIGNETNLAAEWPDDGAGNLAEVTPESYATCYIQCYNAIKSVRPNDKVLPQAISPWAGPYGPGNLGGYNHVGMSYTWSDYLYRMLVSITGGGVTPDGLAMHINSRGYANIFDPVYIQAAGLTQSFTWYVYRDWIQFGTPRSLWNLPLYATECNGMCFWQGGLPGGGSCDPYVAGWMQAVFADINTWNQNAKDFSLPIYRCVNMYRWCCDGWTIDGASNRATILADLQTAAGFNYQWPAFGGNSLSPGTPGGVKITSGITATASSQFSAGEAPAFAFDGNTATKWASTNAAKVHWMAVDLGSEKPIKGYTVKSAGTNGEPAYTNTVGYYIETSSVSATGPWNINTMVRTNTPTSGGGSTDGPAVSSVVYGTPVWARYIRLYVNAPSKVDDYARITEFEIYTGTPTSAGPTWELYE
jgi:F5/8 type C domain